MGERAHLTACLAACAPRPRAVVVGNVLQPNASVMARIGQLLAGVPETVPLATVNRQCSSGLQAVMDVISAVAHGTYEIGIGAGVESMSCNSMTEPTPPDVAYDALSDVPAARDCLVPMGVTSENVAEKYGVDRAAQDAFAVSSHARAAAAAASGAYAAEIVGVPVVVKAEDGSERAGLVDKDDGVRAGTTLEALAKLKPAFKKGGSTTAGNSSQVWPGVRECVCMAASFANAYSYGPRRSRMCIRIDRR